MLENFVLDPHLGRLASWTEMPAYYRAPLAGFVSDSESSIIGVLAAANAAAQYPLSPEAVEAWRLQLPSLIEGCSELITEIPGAQQFEILLEYPIPRVG